MEPGWNHFLNNHSALTDVSLGYEINQIPPLDHLGFFLKVSEVVGDAAHQLKP